MLDVRRLRVLYEVGRRGSFSAAGESLGYTQPAISRQIALLERETGTTLLERRPDGARLTDAGELLARHAETILNRLADAESELDELLGLHSGRLRMSTLTSAASTIVPPAIVEFRKRLPAVELSVSMIDPAGVWRRCAPARSISPWSTTSRTPNSPTSRLCSSSMSRC